MGHYYERQDQVHRNSEGRFFTLVLDIHTTPMKVVAIYPAFAPEINEMAVVWQRLAKAGLVECRVVAGRDDKLKAAQSAEGVQRLANLEILRVPGVLAPGRLDDAAVAWAAEFKPDVIFCALHINIGNAQRIARRCGAPILLHVEAWLDSTVMRRRLYLGIEPLRPIVARARRAWHRRQVQAVAFSDPREIPALQASPGMRYLAWPHPRWSASPVQSREARALDTVAHVGSLYRWKGAERLGEYCERLLRDDPESKLLIVGPIGDQVARRAIDRLQSWSANGRLRHIERLPRTEAMEHIGHSLAVISPHHSGGWGLIGDAWRCGTPVIGVDSHYDLREGSNALVAPSAVDFVSAVRQLRSDARLWHALSSAGQHTAESKHGVDVVAAQLLEFLRAAPGMDSGRNPIARTEP
jgi:glycosyltransferase involved in cell wall biosynthesis